MIRTCWLFSLLLLSAPELVIAHGEDDPMLIAVYADEVEWRDTNEGDSFSWDAQGWVGKDLNKFWWKTEGATVARQPLQRVQQRQEALALAAQRLEGLLLGLQPRLHLGVLVFDVAGQKHQRDEGAVHHRGPPRTST